ncbi:acetyltransferase [Clostridium sp. D2Q-14]|uniref:acetyltransferase n=1 Tax=Anaeromonas gelatinilytica TaxID=2683194 RepID=UPI00193B5131|nr:acetyltransferase [Anaeromonas gelatinilytica]MBS4534479.1 acetyltransferase [Anaeromonas gelatinilytica]
MSKLMILGAGGHGKVVAETAELMNKWDEIAFLDDNIELKEVNGYKVIGKLKEYKLYKNGYQYAFVAIGDNELRLNLINELLKIGFKIPILIHPFTSISDKVHLGKGSVIMAGAVINTNSIIGKGCIINTSSSIDHDCILKDGVHVSPGAHIAGNVIVGNKTWLCIGTSLINDIRIGNNVIVASGASVIKDIEDDVLIAGVPARVIKRHNIGGIL